jgi:DNA-binding MarR family transcriptional regulator
MPTSSATSLAGHELAAWRGMLEVHARVTQQLDAQMQAEHGLSLSAYEVLMFLADAPEHRLRMSEIAKAVLLSRSGCTRLVDRLVDQGYLTRHAATTDGRGLYAQLTGTGLNKVNAARSTHHQGIRRFFLEHLTTTDQIALADIWTRLKAHITPAAGAPPAAPTPPPSPDDIRSHSSP